MMCVARLRVETSKAAAAGQQNGGRVCCYTDASDIFCFLYAHTCFFIHTLYPPDSLPPGLVVSRC